MALEVGKGNGKKGGPSSWKAGTVLAACVGEAGPPRCGIEGRPTQEHPSRQGIALSEAEGQGNIVT